MTHLNRRYLSSVILLGGAAALSGCAALATDAKTLEGDVAITFADAVTAAKTAAAAAATQTGSVIASIVTTPTAEVSGWQEVLGLAEQVLLSAASADPIVATIEGAISAGTTILTLLPSTVSDATELASTLGQLSTATSSLRTAVTSAATFTATVA